MRDLATAVLIIAVACSKPGPVAAPVVENRPEASEPTRAPSPSPSDPDARFEAMMRAAVSMFTALGQAAEAGGSDCGKVADGMGRALDQHQGFLVIAKQLQEDAVLKQRAEAWMVAHSDQIATAITQVGTAAQRCASDAKFLAVVKRLEAMN